MLRMSGRGGSVLALGPIKIETLPNKNTGKDVHLHYVCEVSMAQGS